MAADETVAQEKGGRGLSFEKVGVLAKVARRAENKDCSYPKEGHENRVYVPSDAVLVVPIPAQSLRHESSCAGGTRSLSQRLMKKLQQYLA